MRIPPFCIQEVTIIVVGAVLITGGWNLLNTAEDSLGYQLILRNKGGPSGSGSLLTEKGSALLSASEQFETAARENLEYLYNAYFRDII